MPEMRETFVATVDPVQAKQLALLVDLEAHWENLKKTQSRDPQVRSTLLDLQGKQKAYEAFRTKLVAYNKQFKPAHVPELLLNTPVRLGKWCRAMRTVYLQVEQDLKDHRPVHLLEKAYRWADLLSNHLNKPQIARSAPPTSIKAAIQDLDTLSQWCDDLANVASPAATRPAEACLASA
jgi:hypothetical protein